MNRKSTFIESLADALRGIRLLITREPHAQFHAVVAIGVCIAGLFFQITAVEWMFVAFAIALVLAAEAFNTAIEHLSNVVQPARDERIRTIKDIAAGAVLICTFAAIAIGLLVFIPYIF